MIDASTCHHNTQVSPKIATYVLRLRFQVSVWNSHLGRRVTVIDINENNTNDMNKIESKSNISSLEYINPHDESLLLVGCEDGSIKIYRDYAQDAPGKCHINSAAVRIWIPEKSVTGELVVTLTQKHWIIFLYNISKYSINSKNLNITKFKNLLLTPTWENKSF